MKKSKDDLSDLFAEDSQDKKAPELPSTEKLSELSKLTNRMADLEEKILTAQEDLEKLTKEYNDLAFGKIPDMFDEFGLSFLKLLDGTKIEIARSYSASITEDNKKDCFDWLRKNNHGDIIKHEVTANLKKGENKEAKQITKLLKKLGVTFKDKEGVHPQTLKAFVKEQIETGTDFPQNTFKVFPIRKAKVKFDTF